MPKPHYALRYESSHGQWNHDSELGPRKSVALKELTNLVDALERKFEEGERDWAYVCLIMEAGK